MARRGGGRYSNYFLTGCAAQGLKPLPISEDLIAFLKMGPSFKDFVMKMGPMSKDFSLTFNSKPIW